MARSYAAYAQRGQGPTLHVMMGRMRPVSTVRCPGCGERIWLDIDEPAGPTVPEFGDDCPGCGRPLVFSGFVDETGRLHVQARCG